VSHQRSKIAVAFLSSDFQHQQNLAQYRTAIKKSTYSTTTPATPESFPQYHILFPQHHISRDKLQIISGNVKCDIKQKNAKKKIMAFITFFCILSKLAEQTKIQLQYII